MLGKESLMAFIATANPEACRRFYANTLELTNTEDSPFALEFSVNGTKIRIQKVETLSFVPYTVLGWQVENIAETVRYLTGRGVSFLQFESMPQDELGIWTSPGNAQVAWFKDPDGNTLSLTQRS